MWCISYPVGLIIFSMLIFPAEVSCVPEPFAKGTLNWRRRALTSFMAKGPPVAALVHGICGYGVYLGRPAGA
jgi:hypothetical protein